MSSIHKDIIGRVKEAERLEEIGWETGRMFTRALCEVIRNPEKCPVKPEDIAFIAENRVAGGSLMLESQIGVEWIETFRT